MENELLKYKGGFLQSSQVLPFIAKQLTQTSKQQIERKFNINEGNQRVSLVEYIPQHLKLVEYAEVYLRTDLNTQFNRWTVEYTKSTAQQVQIGNETVPGAILLINGEKATINMKEPLTSNPNDLAEAFINSAITQITQQFPNLLVERSTHYFQYPTIEISDPTGTLTTISQEYNWKTTSVSEYREINLTGPLQFVVRFNNSFLFDGHLDEVWEIPVKTNSPIEYLQYAYKGQRRDRSKIHIGRNGRSGLLPYKFLADFTVEHTTSEGTKDVPQSQYRFNMLTQTIFFNDVMLREYNDQLVAKDCRLYDLPSTYVNEDTLFKRPDKYLFNPNPNYLGQVSYKVWYLYWTQWKLIYPTAIENITNKVVIQSPEIYVEIRDNGDNLEVAYGPTLNIDKNALDENSSSPFVKLDKGTANPIKFHFNWSGDFFNLVLNGNHLYCGRLGGSKEYALAASCSDFTPTQKWGPHTGNGQTDIICGKWFQAHFPKVFVIPQKFTNSTAVNPSSTEAIAPIYIYHDYNKTVGYLQGVVGGHLSFGVEGTRFSVDKPEYDSTGLPLHPLTHQPVFRGQLYVPPPEKEYVQQPLNANNNLFSSLPNQGLTLLVRTK